MLLTSKKKEERQAERGSENQVKVSFRLQTSSNQSQTWEPDVSFVPEGKSVSIVARFIWQQWLFLTVTAQHLSIRFRESFRKSFFMMGFFTQDNFLFFLSAFWVSCDSFEEECGAGRDVFVASMPLLKPDLLKPAVMKEEKEGGGEAALLLWPTAESESVSPSLTQKKIISERYIFTSAVINTATCPLKSLLQTYFTSSSLLLLVLAGSTSIASHDLGVKLEIGRMERCFPESFLTLHSSSPEVSREKFIMLAELKNEKGGGRIQIFTPSCDIPLSVCPPTQMSGWGGCGEVVAEFIKTQSSLVFLERRP